MTMNDEMSADLKDATDFDENAAIASFDEMVAAKTKEIDALTASIESKTARSGDLAVKNTEMMHDLDDIREDKSHEVNRVGSQERSSNMDGQ